MIAKLSTGNGFGGATSYLLRKGKSDEERAKVKVLAAVGVDYMVDKNGSIVLDSRQVARDFRFQSMMRPSVRKPVYHFVFSWKVGEHVPSDDKLARTEEFLQMIGFDNTQYVIVEHEKDNEHSHAIANIVDNDGNRIPTESLIDRMHAVAREITIKYGYQWGEVAKKETVEKAHKPHEKARYTIEPKVKEAVAKANDINDLPDLLKSSGIGCNIKYSEAGKPVGISFSVEFDGQLHTFRGSDLDRSLSAGNIVKTINSRLAQEESNRIAAAALEEQAKAEELRATYIQMVPTIKGLNKTVNDTFQLYSDTKQAGIAIGNQTSQKYAELKQSWTQFRQLNQECNEASTTKALVKSIGGMMMFLNPIVGILVIVIGKIATDIRISSIQNEKKALLTKIEGLKSDIDSLQQQKAQIKIEKQERLNDYLQAKDARNEFRAGMDKMKEEIQQLKEQTKPKFTFDFKAARQQAATAAPVAQNPVISTATPTRSTVDISSILLSAKDKDSLDLTLLAKKVVIEPIKDRFGGVSDFKVTLATEGRVINASNLVLGDRMRQMVDKWESLTGEQPAYKLEIQREHQLKLADICAKMDAASPENAPRIPKSISFLPGGEIDVTYTTRRGNTPTVRIGADGKVKVNNVMLDINTGRFTQLPGQRQAPRHSQGESEGKSKSFGPKR